MRQIRPNPDYSNDLPIYDFLNQMDRRLLRAAKQVAKVIQTSRGAVLITLKYLR